jgi:hypothetical protein
MRIGIPVVFIYIDLRRAKRREVLQKDGSGFVLRYR